MKPIAFLLAHKEKVLASQDKSVKDAWESLCDELPEARSLMSESTFKMYRSHIKDFQDFLQEEITKLGSNGLDASAKEEVSKLRSEIAKLSSALAEKDNWITKLSYSLAQSEEELTKLRSDLVAQDEESPRLQRELEELRLSHALAKEEVTKLRLTQQERDAEITKLRSDLVAQDEESPELEELRLSYQQSQDEITKLRSWMKVLEEELTKVGHSVAARNIDGWTVRKSPDGRYFRLYKSIGGKVRSIHIGKEMDETKARQKIKEQMTKLSENGIATV